MAFDACFGGDSDTIGAIAGGLAGVHCGFEPIPDSYNSIILIKDRLNELIGKIYDLKEART
ncbi:ADP-ribosylglycohydrolase family protein [Paenibacillus sp. 1_12]|uniref:ADP-ribosylglycohydrolase family protein n=1 Tax=Paenibacillus sp. 1_12 TaxID=1566278 RepID=UPI00210A0B84|nr:ADP-ribosylglycohydrolase family protein [Paenibacillus sp. 1_12]